MMKILDAKRLDFVFVPIMYVMGVATVQMAVMKKIVVCKYVGSKDINLLYAAKHFVVWEKCTIGYA